MRPNLLPLFMMAALASGCGTRPIANADRHINAAAEPVAANIPAPVRPAPLPPQPRPQPKVDRYSVTVNQIPVQELLFALARDAKINVDVHPGIEGRVTLNAIDQTLPQILTRITKQVDMRFEMDGPNLAVMPDSPYLKSYRIDYVNMARSTKGDVGVSTQVATTGSSTSTGVGGGGGNNSATLVSNVSANTFWGTLVANVKDLLRETDKVFPKGSTETETAQSTTSRRVAQGNQPQIGKAKDGANGKEVDGTLDAEIDAQNVERKFTFREAASVIANPEAGVISVRASSRQHERVQEFLDQVMGSAKRQVMIEATIVEVDLNDGYQAGVDWSRLSRSATGFTFQQSFTPGNFAASPLFSLTYTNPLSSLGDITAAIKALSTFGTTRVLSSPRLMALNNQTALLKVVDERVYFTTDVRITDATDTRPEKREFTTVVHTVPVGVVMSVTPQISSSDQVSLNIRPTISRISGFVNDPTPALSGNRDVVNRIPEIQVREVESLLQVPSGQVAVLGGLMQDRETTQRDGVPLLSRIPLLGDAFSYRNDVSRKTELVIFLRPVVVREANVASMSAADRASLPDRTFHSGERRPIDEARRGVP